MSDRCSIPGTRLFAPAKVNLGLEVLRRRDDGYHEVVSVLETISLFDLIDISPAPQSSVQSPVSLDGEADLVEQALRRLEERCSVDIPIRVSLTKRIPIAAGLGGGSSDAGTVLAYLSRAMDLDRTVVLDVASSLGSDVPFFLSGGTASVHGTGTDVRAIEAKGRRWYIIVVPELTIPEKTRTLYQELSSDHFSDGEATKAIAETLKTTGRFDPSTMRNAFTHRLLERPAFQHAYESLLRAGATNAIPAGAGPAVFALFHSYAEAVEIARRIDRSTGTVHIATSIGSSLNA